MCWLNYLWQVMLLFLKKTILAGKAGEPTLTKTLLPFMSTEVYSKRSEFLPWGAYTFLSEKNAFSERPLCARKWKENHKSCLHFKNGDQNFHVQLLSLKEEINKRHAYCKGMKFYLSFKHDLTWKNTDILNLPNFRETH